MLFISLQFLIDKKWDFYVDSNFFIYTENMNKHLQCARYHAGQQGWSDRMGRAREPWPSWSAQARLPTGSAEFIPLQQYLNMVHLGIQMA